MQFKFANGVRVGQQNDLKWLPLLPGCGTQHPHRALGGTCVLLAAAPTTPPCFRRWRRSSSLLAMFSGKIIFNFAFAERSAAMKAPVGLLSGRAVCVSRWRGFAPTSSAERDKRIFTGGIVTEAAAAFPPYTVKRGCCAKCCATAPVILCYIFSGTLILNMVSTLKMAFFTPMHRARRACCTAGSAP